MKMMIATKFSLAVLGVAVISSTGVVQAKQGRFLRSSSSSSSSSYRRHLLDDQPECVLYKAEKRFEGENGGPAYDEEFWACEFPREQTKRRFGRPNDIMMKLDGLTNSDIESRGAVSGESVLKASNMIIEERLDTHEKKLRVNPEDAVVEPLSENDMRHARNRRLAMEEKRRNLASSSPGTYNALVVRVIDSKDKVLPVDAATLSTDVFSDSVSLGTHYRACSKDRFSIEPSSDGDGTGVVDVKVDVEATSSSIESAAIEKAEELYGGNSGLWSKYDLVLFCQPPVESSNWVAYAYINHYMSFYNSDWCSQVSAQMHEVGHNLGLAHSGHNGDAYGDQSGMMGYSYFSDDGPQMCFNPAKSYQLGWYDDQQASIDPSLNGGSHAYTLNGAADYKSNPDALVTLRLELNGGGDYYVGYNRAVGPNSGTQEAQNKVVIVKKSGGPYNYGESDLVASLSSSQSWSISNWNGNEGVDVTVTVDGTIGGSVQDAKIVVTSTATKLVDETEQPTESPITKPTQAPNPTCKDKKKFVWKEIDGEKIKKKCSSWVPKQLKKNEKFCKKKTSQGIKIREHCPSACGLC